MSPEFVIEKIESKFCLDKEVLSLGADTVQKISWARSGGLYSLVPSKPFKDPEEFYRSAAKKILRRLKFRPRVILFDPHPNFVSSKIASELGANLFPNAQLRAIYHHRAHAARFFLENGRKNFIAATFDGTGFGEDRLTWGGEFFVSKNGCMLRAAHFDNQFLPGLEMAIRQPWRVAFAILWRLEGRGVLKHPLHFLSKISDKEKLLVVEMLEKNFNSPLSSSVGRLFDAASALLDLKTHVSGGAQAAILLEKTALTCADKGEPYPLGVVSRHGNLVVDVLPLFKAMSQDLKKKVAVERIALRFHETIAQAALEVSLQLSRASLLKEVYFSGGVFMNALLRRLIRDRFLQKGLRPVIGSVPGISDAGISEGQIAAWYMEDRCA